VISVKPLHVVTAGCHLQGVSWNKWIKVLHANLGLASPSVGCDSNSINIYVSETLLELLKFSTFLLFPRQKSWTQNPLVTECVRAVFSAYEMEVSVFILSWPRRATVSP